MYCDWCNAWIEWSGHGRTPRFCSSNCRVASHRSAGLPAELIHRNRWTRAEGKRPVRPEGWPASSTNPNTWTRWQNVRQGAGDGFGIMLGDGLGCYDLDNCFEDDGALKTYAAELLESVDPIFVERSVSGRGLHIFVHAPEAKGWRRDGIEFYSRDRFIRVTGDRFEASLLPAC